MKKSLFAVFLILLFTDHVNAAEIQHFYDWLTNGVKSGSLVVTVSDENNTRTARFEFNDRGRGPDLSETTRFGADGVVTSLEITGHSYMGAAVEERFERSETGTKWSSTLEEGSAGTAPAFYLANDGTPEQTAMLARALLASRNQSLDLLPGGRARISKLDEYSRSGSSAFGEKAAIASKSLVLSLYAISGTGMNPEFVWLDQNMELFGLAGGSFSLAPAGWPQVMKQLRSRQDKAEQAWYRKRSRLVTHEIPGDYAITNANVVDVETGTLLENRTVLVSGGLISEISEAAPAGRDIGIFDAKGGYLVPGLWDMHTHMSLNQGLLHLAAGVTTVRDMGNNPERYRSIRESFDTGTVAGPRSYAAGIVERKSPYSAPIKAMAESREDALKLVRKYAVLGYPQIKVYSSVEPDWIKAIAEETHANNMRLSGHIPSFMTAERAVRDGFDEIQHINMLYLNFLAGPEDDTRTPVRFTLVAEKGASLDLESAQVLEFMDLLKANDVVIDPTVAIFDNMFRHRSGQVSPAFAGIADHFPPAVKRSMLAGRMNINDENAGQYAAAADHLLDMILLLHRRGIRIVAGTDAMPGFSLHRELELYQKAGIPAGEVLKIATLNAADLMNASNVSGSITKGKQADMILLTANPLTDIGAVRHAKMVFRGDRYFKPAQVYLAVGIKPFN